MKRILTLLSFLLMSVVWGAAQSTSVPTCNGFSATGVPIDTSGSTVCTDYFGVGNWANSPLPAGTITGFTLIMSGSGYVNPQVTITDITGSGATATATFANGAITGITGSPTPNYTMPQVTIVDTNCGTVGLPACGSGAMATAIIGPPFTAGTGILKFQDALPDLKSAIATPDITTFPGSDFYSIGLVEYKTQMHASLPPTTLRGYCQLINGTCSNQSYLGPVIVAQKNRPVRVLFRNLLPAGAGGNLFIPVDSTYMGANLPQNRATLHLHGGVTPWISDGTPHQWTTPEGDTLMTGPSTQPVPDMYFAGGSIVPYCSATVTSNCYPNGAFTGSLPAGATTTPPVGDMTFYWTNQQGGRLMFYHDHSYGITRLNVYAGEAAGYLLYDPVEETALANAGAPGSITAGDLTHLIPLVIQDKTFVTPAQIPVQDPTWAPFGTTPGTPNLGDLWFPHVYIPNQDPNDPMGGANGFGRWDYGAWFFPPQTSLTAGVGGAVTIPCTSAAFPGQVLQPLPANNNMNGCPIIPNPSGTPEGFMDTPIVNGKAYPVLHVAPEAYRFKILSAGNDRSWNLSWFIADPTQLAANNTATEVAMLPAVPPSTGSVLPLCSQINPIAVPMLDIGLVTAVLDASGNPLNGTGLPNGTSGCWPNYGPQPGIPKPQAMWAADGRAGGAPDPRTAGPAWVQIGTEGGLLPTPVVIPPTPINYEQNTRSITITSVAAHGLWLGPAERADVIVDFSQFAGKTLILYNDAPTPAPAYDSRLDYFTNDGDQTPIGGAPNTPAGYGPNTRTIMQVFVDLPTQPLGKPLSLPALKAAFASTATTPGIFAATQPTTIVPEPAYNSAYNAVFPPKYSGIGDNSMTFTPIVPLNFESLLSQEQSACSATAPVLPVQCGSFNHKAIQELFTLDYGRMNATLGTELPNVNFTNQTTIPLAYVDPATEIIRQGDTQLWKITHNGVDSHFIHFHLFNVQVINRVGWDGSLRPPDANEMGWKDTVRMNPLEDVLVALQPLTPQLPWPIPNSVRRNDVLAGMNMFTNVDPFTNNPAATADGATNFGWEYVWHCHILGHEENDMMRPIMYQVPPGTPSNLVVASALAGGVDISFVDNSASETGFTVQRDIDPAFPSPTIIPLGPSATLNAVGEGTDWGATITTNDATPLTVGKTYYYRVQAVDDGFRTPFEQSYNPTSALISGWSNVATILPVPIAGITPTSLVFGNVNVNTSTTTLANGQTAQVTISNVGTAALNMTGMTVTGANPGDFTFAPICTIVNPGVTNNCSFTVTFAPTAVGAEAALLTVTTNDPAHPTLTVSMTGVGIAATSIAINAPTITYGVNGAVTLTVSATSGFIPTGNVTLTVDGGAPLSQALSTTGTAAFTVTLPTAGTHALVANYAAQGAFLASTANGTLVVNGAPLTITASSGTMVYGGTPPVITPTFAGFVNGDTSTVLTTQPTCSTAALSTSPVGTYPSSCTGAAAANYAITYVAGTVTVTPANLIIIASTNTMPYGGPVPAITPTFAGFLNGDTNLTALTMQPTCTTTATVTTAVGLYVTANNCTGAVGANYSISYIAGRMTVTAAPLTITASTNTMPYGGPVPLITPSFTGFLNGDTNTVLTAQPICSTTATITTGVGAHANANTCAGAAAANYAITYVGGTMNVTAVPLVITASNGTMTYGGPVPIITPIYAGFVAGDTAASLTTKPTCVTTATSTSPVGIAPTSCAGAVDPNYAISYVPGTVTISKATTAVAITSNLPNPAIVGQIVTINIAVIPQFAGSVPTGTVTVKANPNELCSVALPASACNLIFMTGGTRTLTANYVGDGNFLGSTSAVVNQGVSGVSLSTTALLFGNQLVLTNSATQTITLSNVGTVTININSIVNSNTPDFNFTTTCGLTLRAGRSCNVVVRFHPQVVGVRTGTITFTDSDPTPQVVSLTGTGIAPFNQVSPLSLPFGTIPNRTVSAAQTVTVTNTGTAPLVINRINLNGANPGQFVQNNTCPASLAAGANCTINVTFHPTTRGAKGANLNVTVAAPAVSQTVALTGTSQ